MSEYAIRPLESSAEAEACARLMSESEPWITLGRSYAACLRVLQHPTRERYVAPVNAGIAGFLILSLEGSLSGYLQTVCVAPPFRGQGLGSRLVAFAEERIFRAHPNVFMCVSSFNGSALRLYQRLGYTIVGELTDYLVEGHSEILLRKTRGPFSTFRAERGP